MKEYKIVGKTKTKTKTKKTKKEKKRKEKKERRRKENLPFSEFTSEEKSFLIS